MDKTALPPDEIKLMLFQGDNYTLDVPRNWLIMQVDENGRIGFLGPNVGSMRVGFFIGEMANDQSCQALAEQTVTAQAQEAEQFQLLDTADVSGDQFSAIIQAIRFFNAEENMVVYRRQMFIDIDGRTLAMFSTVPNTPHLESFDRLFTKIFNSFRVGQVVYTPLA